MKYLSIIVFGLSVVASCTYWPQEKKPATSDNKTVLVLQSFYKKLNDTIAFKRFLVVTNSKLLVQDGLIFPGYYGLTYQRFTDTFYTHMKGNMTIDSLTTRYEKEGFVKEFISGRDVIVVQIISDSVDNFNSFWQSARGIEAKIDKRLKSKDLGEWFTGEIGVNGDMLFFVDNLDSGKDTVMQVLIEEKLVDYVLIARRIMINPTDGTYEIVYPTDYQGVLHPI